MFFKLTAPSGAWQTCKKYPLAYGCGCGILVFGRSGLIFSLRYDRYVKYIVTRIISESMVLDTVDGEIDDSEHAIDIAAQLGEDLWEIDTIDYEVEVEE